MFHLYYKSSISKQILDITRSFESCNRFDISEIDEIEDAEIYLVEIPSRQKSPLLKIKKLLSQKSNSLIYFFTDDTNSLALYKLAFELGTKSIISPKDDTSKVINEIKKESNKTALDFIKNRIYFIEILKEKLLEKNISHNRYSIITISIENMDKMCQFWSVYEIEMAIRDLLLQVELEIEPLTLLAQYSCNLYLALFEDLDFEATKEKAHTIQKHILSYSSKEEIQPMIGLHALDADGLELNSALNIISDISKDEISSKDIDSQKIYRAINIDADYTQEQVIDILLQTTFTNNTPIKLLNTYKGLCINTPSKILKKTQDEIYVSFEPIQGTVMDFKKKTVLQSQNFTKDIAADVKIIDLKKRVALLKEFRFISGNANARKYSRVTPSQRTPISIITKRGSLSGEITDISMNSIAIRTRVLEDIEELNATDIELRFTLPVKSSMDGYMKLELVAKVTFTKSTQSHSKIVADLEGSQKYEAILMEYVYNRQKELIVELKKQIIMQNKL